jgi:hypothetical protein
MKQVFRRGEPMFFREEFSKKTIVQLRWALIVVIGYIVVFSHFAEPLPLFLYFFLPVYVSSNIFLFFSSEKWFQEQRFISLILLLDLSMTVLTIFQVGPKGSEFFVTFFLVLLISAITRKALLVYTTFGIILVVYGITCYLKAPENFFSTASLLQFPFIVILALVFRGMVESYNRVYQEKELLKEDYRELDVLTSVALSIGQERDLSAFLFKLSRLLSEKLGLCRCTAIFMDSDEDTCYMVSSDDLPEKEPLIIDVKNYPALKESLKSEEISEEKDSGLPEPLERTSKYILKKIPIIFKRNMLGTLYLRANTQKLSLTHREEYFLLILGRITALAIMDLERSPVLETVLERRPIWLER